MRALRLLLALGCGCGRVGFDGGEVAFEETCPTAIYCDDFERGTALRPGDPVWAEDSCDLGGTLETNGELAIAVPSFNGSRVASCALRSHPADAASGSRFEMAFDITLSLDPSAMSLVGIAEVRRNLAAPDPAGVEQVIAQLLVNGAGHGNLTIVFWYPDESLSPDGSHFPGFAVADSSSQPWIDVGAPCRVTLTVDLLAPAGTATARCGGQLRSLDVRTPSAPRGLSGPPIVGLGYLNAALPTSAWALAYDNLVFR